MTEVVKSEQDVSILNIPVKAKSYTDRNGNTAYSFRMTMQKSKAGSHILVFVGDFFSVYNIDDVRGIVDGRLKSRFEQVKRVDSSKGGR